MDSKELQALMESYSAVYQEETDLQEDLSIIDEVSDEELQSVVEEVIYDLLEEGYSTDDLEEIFEEEIFDQILSEARVTSSDDRKPRSGGSSAVTTGTGSRMAAASRLADMKRSRRERRKEKVKSAIKTGISKARKLVDDPAREYAAKRKLVPSRSGKTTLTSPAIQAKQRTSAGRREVRSRVAGDIASRLKAKIGRGIQKAKTMAAGAASAAMSAPKAIKTAAKKGIRKAALGVAKRMKEDVDLYDLVLEHLIENGYAKTEESAVAIMANMSEEWKNEIIEINTQD